MVKYLMRSCLSRNSGARRQLRPLTVRGIGSEALNFSERLPLSTPSDSILQLRKLSVKYSESSGYIDCILLELDTDLEE